MATRLVIALSGVLVTVLLTVGVEAKRATAHYSIVDLGTLGGTESFAYALNDPGHVVGLSRMAGDNDAHAFLYQSGVLTDLAPLNSGHVLTTGPTGINNLGLIASGVIDNGIYVPALYDARTGVLTTLGSLGGATSYGFNGAATAVNNYGHAVGYSHVDGIRRHAFLFKDGVMADIFPGGNSVAFDINDDDVIVGVGSQSIPGYAHAFVYANGQLIEIDPFGGPNNESYARAVNNNGDVVGSALLPSATAFHGFLYSNGSITDIGTLPGGRNSEAMGINERNEIVGLADSPYETICWLAGFPIPCIEYEQLAVMYRNGQLVTLNSLIPSDSGWNLTWAFDINSRGQIVGYGIRDGRFRAYLMTRSSK